MVNDSMTESNVGGNLLKNLKINSMGRHVFAQSPYVYYYHAAGAGETLQIDDLKSYSIYILLKSDRTTIELTAKPPLQKTYGLQTGDVLKFDHTTLALHCKAGPATFLIVGLKEGAPVSSISSHTPFANIKKVSKPWGHELWITGEQSPYVLKQIFIKAGTKTSLQYHRMKRETNVLFEGEAILHYKMNLAVTNDDVSPSDISQVTIKPIASVDVPSNTLHRLEAVSDTLLYEASTPHLDDVVRVSDDSGRSHGRIASEHTLQS